MSGPNTGLSNPTLAKEEEETSRKYKNEKVDFEVDFRGTPWLAAASRGKLYISMEIFRRASQPSMSCHGIP